MHDKNAMSGTSLRHEIVQAIAAGRTLHDAEQRRIREAREKKAREEALRANAILLTVGTKVMDAASLGKTKAVIMKLEYTTDYVLKPASPYDVLRVDELTGAAALVYDRLCEINKAPDGGSRDQDSVFPVSLERYDDSGERERDEREAAVGFQITVSW